MNAYFENKITARYFEEAKAFRTRASINTAYVKLKKEYDKLAEIIDRNDLPPEIHINSDLSALVVELSETIAKISQRNANLQRDLKNVTTRLDYYEHW